MSHRSQWKKFSFPPTLPYEDFLSQFDALHIIIKIMQGLLVNNTSALKVGFPPPLAASDGNLNIVSNGDLRTINPLTPKISSVILLTVCLKFLRC